jgi:hypothetical protein
MKKLSVYLSVITLLLAFVPLQSCKKDKKTDPQVQTGSATAISSYNVLFKGTIVSTGSFTILDYGFVYSTTSTGISETTGTKVSLGQNPQAGEYSKEVDKISVTNYYSPIIYFKAYIKSEKGTVFGELQSITLPIPVPSKVSTLTGKSGDQITISGQFYNTSISNVGVIFGGVKATVVSASSTQIVVTVPSGIKADENAQIPMILAINGQDLHGPYSFTIQSHFKDFSPKSGPIGTYITFSGDNLPNLEFAPGFTVIYGNVTQGVTILHWRAFVPLRITSNNLQISVKDNNNNTFILPGAFTVLPLAITSMSPASGPAGSTVTVTGTNFPYSNVAYDPADPTGAAVTGTLGNAEFRVTLNTNDQLSFTVPDNLPAGTYNFVLHAGPDSATAPQTFTVTP